MIYAILIFILLAIFLYTFKRRLAGFMNILVQVIFVASVTGGLVSLFIPSVFTSIANRTLTSNGTLETIRGLDKVVSLDQITLPGTQFMDNIKDFFGGNTEQPKTPTQGSKTGLIEGSVYPSILSSIAGVYRWGTLIVSLILMIFSLYVSYLFTAAGDVSGLEQRIQLLEAELTELKQSARM